MNAEIKMPDIGLDEVEVIEILVKLNDNIILEQGLITVEGDKTSMEIPSPMIGVVRGIHIKVGDKIKTSSLIMTFEVQGNTSSLHKKNINFLKKEGKELLNNNFFENSRHDSDIHATPLIRRLARSLNIDLKNISATGRKKRILKEDVNFYKKNIELEKIEKNEIFSVNDAHALTVEEITLSNMQKITGDNLHQNWINIPHVTQFDEVNISNLEKFRQKYNKEKENNKVTILVFILKIVAYALEKFPIFNSSLDSSHKNIILKKYINIGVAVEVEKGLIVPVLKDVNKKNIEELSFELRSLSKKARENKLNALDVKNGCFTISNLGGIGGSWFSPIINAPEVAILGVSKSQIKPFWDGEKFVPSLMLPLSLSYNHRVINGADAARFITFINKLLSDIHFLFM